MTRILLVGFLALSYFYSCSNNPYPPQDRGKNIYYTTFGSEPKHLDPAKAYSSDEYTFMLQIYEPLLQYHYLKRPYVLESLLTDGLPKFEVYQGRPSYRIKLKKGILYAKHPAFAKNNKGKYIWHLKDNQSLPKINHPLELKKVEQRELVASDIEYQLKRLAHPLINSPILPVFIEYIIGMKKFYKSLKIEINKIRTSRRKEGGIFYNRQSDEKKNPLYIDLRKLSLTGFQKISKYEFRIILKK